MRTLKSYDLIGSTAKTGTWAYFVPNGGSATVTAACYDSAQNLTGKTYLQGEVIEGHFVSLQATSGEIRAYAPQD